jgi:hypothetical protein
LIRRGAAIGDACTFCLERRNLRCTVSIAIVVGIILTLINQGSVITAGTRRLQPGRAAR